MTLNIQVNVDFELGLAPTATSEGCKPGRQSRVIDELVLPRRAVKNLSPGRCMGWGLYAIDEENAFGTPASESGSFSLSVQSSSCVSTEESDCGPASTAASEVLPVCTACQEDTVTGSPPLLNRPATPPPTKRKLFYIHDEDEDETLDYQPAVADSPSHGSLYATTTRMTPARASVPTSRIPAQAKFTYFSPTISLTGAAELLSDEAGCTYQDGLALQQIEDQYGGRDPREMELVAEVQHSLSQERRHAIAEIESQAWRARSEDLEAEAKSNVGPTLPRTAKWSDLSAAWEYGWAGQRHVRRQHPA